MQNEVEHLKTMVRDMKNANDESTANKLNLEKCERIIDRLSTFSDSCKECNQSLYDMKDHISELHQIGSPFSVNKFKQHSAFINKIAVHFQKQHKLVEEGTYLSIYMSLGLSLGIVFGLMIFDNIGLGMSLGMCMGLALGAGLDSDAKKKGKTI